MLAEIECRARRAINAGAEPSTVELLALYDSLLSDHPHRDEVRAFVMAYLVKSLVGVTPNYRVWDPFS